MGDKLGEFLRNERKTRGLTLRGLATTAGVDYSWLGRLENGQYESPDPRALYKLARALDIEVNELYLLAGYSSADGLPRFDLYLRSKYDLPDDAVAQLNAHFELINEKYQSKQGDTHDKSSRHPT